VYTVSDSVKGGSRRTKLDGSLVITPRGNVQARIPEMQEIVGPHTDVIFCPDRDVLAEVIENAEIMGGVVPKAIFHKARSLRWMHTWSAGVDGALHPALIESGITFTCSSGNAAHPIAEHGILLMLMLQQQSVRALQQQREHRWQQFDHPELYGKTVGIIGLGDIGLELARRARAFHMRILGMRRTDKPCPEVDELYPRERLAEMLAASDFVVMAAPITAETHKMIGEAEFRAMKPTAYFINISRGGCVDENALIRCMREGWIAGAGIDQPTQKPLPPESELWDLPNTLITPAYGGHTLETHQRSIAIFIDNLRRYMAGEPLRNVVNMRLGY
jgi:phosphoglycerate dehydrogenase-like enzyme